MPASTPAWRRELTPSTLIAKFKDMNNHREHILFKMKTAVEFAKVAYKQEIGNFVKSRIQLTSQMIDKKIQ